MGVEGYFQPAPKASIGLMLGLEQTQAGPFAVAMALGMGGQKGQVEQEEPANNSKKP